MASRFKKFTRAFGVLEGAWFYTRFKLGQPRRLRSRKYGTTINLRPGTSDAFTFEQVFLHELYAFRLPFQPRRIIDAGANIGLTALYLAQRYPEATIATVEPSAENVAQLKLNTAVHSDRMRHFHHGLWSRECVLEITDPYRSYNSFVVQEAAGEPPGAIPAISVPALLKALQWDTIDLLKIDIEGAEKEVFAAGYETWLPRTRALCIELHDSMKQGCSQSVLRAMARYNFSVSPRDEMLVFVNEDPARSPAARA